MGRLHPTCALLLDESLVNLRANEIRMKWSAPSQITRSSTNARTFLWGFAFQMGICCDPRFQSFFLGDIWVAGKPSLCTNKTRLPFSLFAITFIINCFRFELICQNTHNHPHAITQYFRTTTTSTLVGVNSKGPFSLFISLSGQIEKVSQSLFIVSVRIFVYYYCKDYKQMEVTHTHSFFQVVINLCPSHGLTHTHHYILFFLCRHFACMQMIFAIFLQKPNGEDLTSKNCINYIQPWKLWGAYLPRTPFIHSWPSTTQQHQTSSQTQHLLSSPQCQTTPLRIPLLHQVMSMLVPRPSHALLLCRLPALPLPSLQFPAQTTHPQFPLHFWQELPLLRPRRQHVREERAFPRTHPEHAQFARLVRLCSGAAEQMAGLRKFSPLFFTHFKLPRLVENPRSPQNYDDMERDSSLSFLFVICDSSLNCLFFSFSLSLDHRCMPTKHHSLCNACGLRFRNSMKEHRKHMASLAAKSCPSQVRLHQQEEEESSQDQPRRSSIYSLLN